MYNQCYLNLMLFTDYDGTYFHDSVEVTGNGSQSRASIRVLLSNLECRWMRKLRGTVRWFTVVQETFFSS